MGEASMRKWLRRAAVHRGLSADDLPGWRRWVLRLWRSPTLRAAMRRYGLPLYHVALRMRRQHRQWRHTETWIVGARRPGLTVVPRA